MRICSTLLPATLACSLALVPTAALHAEHHESAAEQASVAAEPRAVVDSLQSTLIGYMRSATEGDGPDAAQVDRLRGAVLTSHDFAYIARIVLGRTWRQLEDGDRERFVERFTALSLATYAKRFAEFSGEAFTVLNESDGSFGQRKVSAELLAAGKRHSFDYLLRQADGQWRIVNIIVDGVSDLALKRAEYSTLVGEVGFDGLLEELERQRTALSQEAAGA